MSTQTEAGTTPRPASPAPAAAVAERAAPEAGIRRRRGISVVWLVPLVAAAIAIWLGVVTLRAKGPTITVSFETAESLEAGKTKVRYKDVEIGSLVEVRLSDDRRSVVAVFDMAKQAEDFMREGTRFWVVRPRIGASGVSGLGTLFSGAFIELDPGKGAAQSSFVGLEEPPPLTSDEPGRRFVLEASTLGSIDRGAPIYYHGIEVGQILDYRLAPDKRTLEVDIFVQASHQDLVRPSSKFWNASGFDISLGSGGVQVSTESLQTIIAGGIAFDTSDIESAGEPAAEGRRFQLYASRRQVDEPVYTTRVPYRVYFDGSVRGLRPGAAVEFSGIRIGQVRDVQLRFDTETRTPVIPVTLDIEPERIGTDAREADLAPYTVMAELVRQGLRAKLGMGNLLTGELIVELGFFPGVTPAELKPGVDGNPPVLPSVPADRETIARSVTRVVEEIAQAPIAELVQDLRRTVQGVERLVASPETVAALASLKGTADELQILLQRSGPEVTPLLSSLRRTADAASGALGSTGQTMSSVQDLVGNDSKLRRDLDNLMAQLAAAARSMRAFTDYLDRHPEALLRGKAN